MTKLREGDIVTFDAVVESVAPMGDDQQIIARIQPNGMRVGWCIPKENAFTPKELVIRVGDRVTWSGQGIREFEVLFIEGKQATVRAVGEWRMKIAMLSELRRL